MNRDADNFSPALADVLAPQAVQWVALCAERLREQWPRADPTSLEETARELRGDEALRACRPDEAAVKWLRRGMPT